MMQGFCQHPDIGTLSGEAEFLEQEEPRAHSGYYNPMNVTCFVSNLANWEKWHREWYSGPLFQRSVPLGRVV